MPKTLVAKATRPKSTPSTGSLPSAYPQSFFDPVHLQAPLSEALSESSQAVLTATEVILTNTIEARSGLTAALTGDTWRALKVWTAAALSTHQAVLDSWGTLLDQAEQFAQAAATEYRYSAVELLHDLDRKELQRQQLEGERDKERERAERERGHRHQAESDRDREREQVKQEHSARQRAEQAVRRLERELEDARSRAERAEHARERLQARAATADKAPVAGEVVDQTLSRAVNVVKREDDWAVVREDAKRASGVFDTKREAVQRAREIARNDDVEVHIEPTAQSVNGGA